MVYSHVMFDLTELLEPDKQVYSSLNSVDSHERNSSALIM